MGCEKDVFIIVEKLRDINTFIASRGLREIVQPFGKLSNDTLNTIKQKTHEIGMCAECISGADVVCDARMKS